MGTHEQRQRVRRVSSMNLVKLQDTKLIHRTLLHSCILIMKDQKERLRKQSHLSPHQNKTKQNKTPRNKPTSVSSVAQSCPTLFDPMNCSTSGLPVHHQLPESTQTHVHWVSDAIQPSHPLSSPSPPALNLSQHQGVFKWVSSLLQVAKVLEFQLQHQSFQWIFSTDFF